MEASHSIADTSAEITLFARMHDTEHTFAAGRNGLARRGGPDCPPHRHKTHAESRRRWASGSDSSFFSV